MGVRVVERVGHLPRDPHGVVNRQGSLALDALVQRLALYEGHDTEGKAIHLPRVVEGHYVGVRE
jgi:hypothetical protein